VQADLKKMARGGYHSDEEEEGGKKKKAKRTGPSLLQLEREKYLKGNSASGSSKSKGKGRKEDDDIMDALDGFKSKLLQAKVHAPKAGGDGDEEGEDDDTVSTVRLLQTRLR
jgi:hypothetical protein